MHSAHRNPLVLRRRIAFALLAGLFGLALIGLTQCRMVDDNVTGVQVQTESGLNGKDGNNGCIRACNSAFKKAKKEEDDAYRKARRACGSDRGCRKKVERAHQHAINDLLQEKRDCKRNCYNEGSGAIGR